MPDFSFEFFPPRSAAQERRFWTTFGALQTLKPQYISMTWGALGTASQASLDVLEGLMTDSKVPVAAHLTCVGHTAESIKKTINSLDSMGVKRFVALRGDQPDGKPDPALLQHASELVEILAQDPSRDISVAAYPEAHPESIDDKSDMQWLKFKLDKGAKRAITQFFFSADTFLRFRDRAVAAGITQELVPGILPIHNIEKVQQFSQQCGAKLPADLLARFAKATDPGTARTCAVEHAVDLIDSLHREGVGHVHLYTLNQSTLAFHICNALSRDSDSSSVNAAA